MIVVIFLLLLFVVVQLCIVVYIAEKVESIHDTIERISLDPPYVCPEDYVKGKRWYLRMFSKKHK